MSEERKTRKIRLKEVFPTTTESQWTFQPIAANGEPQSTSEPYVSKSNAKQGAGDLFPNDDLIFVVADPDDPEKNITP